jgi:nifR3 family TIM-barrel protein
MNAAAFSLGIPFRAPLTVGALHLSGRAFLAPMSGVTDVGMRRVAMQFGAGLVVSEMVASDDFVRGEEESRIRAEGEGVSPHVVQIAGRDPHWMGEAARLAEASGADAIDINMGCPAKRVTGGLAGSALMRDIDLATDIVHAAVAAVSVPVTLKMRLGWDHSCLNAPELARRAEAEGIALLTIHGRTRAQFYKGEADWRAIRLVKQAVTIPVVANGDCTTPADAVAMLVASDADAVMIGRGAVGRPWFVGQIARLLATGKLGALPSLDQRRAAALTHYRTLLSLFGRGQGLRHARKHLAAYAEWAARDGSPSAAALRLPLVTSENPAEVERLLSGMFEYEPVLEAA